MSERKQTQNTSPPPASHLGPARGCWAAMRMLSTGTWTPNSCPSVQIQWHFQNVSLLWGWGHKFQPGIQNQFGDAAWYSWVINMIREGKAWSSLPCNGFIGVGTLHPRFAAFPQLQKQGFAYGQFLSGNMLPAPWSHSCSHSVRGAFPRGIFWA